MRILSIVQEFNKDTYESPHELILNNVKTGVRWNGDTKKELYGDNPVRDSAGDLAHILVSELDYELKLADVGLSKIEKACYYDQLITHLSGYPD